MPRAHHKRWSVWSMAAGAMLLSACSHNHRMREVDTAFAQADWTKAADAMRPVEQEFADDSVNALIFHLEAGEVLQSAGDTGGSLKSFDAAYAIARPYLDEKADVSISAEAAALVTNQTVRPFRGRPIDRIMMNALQAINYWSVGRVSEAGVELNRAMLWQNDAVARNAKRIEALQAQVNERARADGYNVAAAKRDHVFSEQAAATYAPVRAMQGYADYAVPYVTFLRGAWFWSTGQPSDLDQARQAFERVAAMLPEADRAHAMADLAMVEAALAGQGIPDMVWVVLESGLAPSLKELRIDIPLFIDEVPYVGAAFPEPVFRQMGPDGFTVTAGSESVRSSLLTDIDSAWGRQFNDELPAIITATILSSATKAILTWQLQEQLGTWGAVAGALYQVGLNSADLRTWTTLPKRVLSARIPVPADRRITIAVDGGETIGPIECPIGHTTIIHLRGTAAGRPCAVRTLGGIP
ncbi:MAG: hypothetical protein FJ254_00380 [Phycisphaerae bacterium]|nr:hypothetical protein [Phycisphaerae bacterium]